MSPLRPEAMDATEFDSLFAEAEERYVRAEARSGLPVRRDVRIAGRHVSFRFASREIDAAVFPAFAHLAVPPADDPALEIWVSDGDEPANAPPFSRRAVPEQDPGGETLHFVGDGRMLHVLHPFRLIAAAHREARRVVVWLASIGAFEARERASPFPFLFNWWLNPAGYVRVHAAAVGRPEGGVLIVAPSGSGKSHTALACLQSDLRYASDDFCLLGTSGAPDVASLYSTGKLFMRDVHRFPHLAEAARDAPRTDEDKAILFLNGIMPGQLISGFPVRAILLPTVSGRTGTTLVPASAAPAFRHLGPENALRGAALGRRAFAGLASVLRATPCFRLEAGTDLAGIPRAISALLDDLAR